VTSLPADLALVLLSVAAFTAAGELVLGRRSRDLVAGNDSFLSGLAVAAAALFPLSILFRGAALSIELGLLGIALLAAVARRVPGRRPLPPRAPAASDPWTTLALSGVLVAAFCFTLLDLRHNLFWDGLLIWASRAQVLFHEGFLGRSWYPDDAYELRHLTYPPLVPLSEALFLRLRGRFDFDLIKPVFLPFYFSLLVSIYGGIRAVASPRRAMTATLLLAFLGPLATRHAAGGYADMPQAAFVAGVVGAALRRRAGEDALPWLVGGLTTVKAEGTVLAAIAVIAALATRWLERAGPPASSRRPARALAIVGGFFLVRFVYLRWLGVVDPVYVPLDAAHLPEALRRIPHVARTCLAKALVPRRWGLLWPAFAASALVLLRRGRGLERAVAVATGAAAVLLAAPFLVTTWPLDLQIDQAYPRLLEQLAPAAVAVAVLGWIRAGSPAAAPDR